MFSRWGSFVYRFRRLIVLVTLGLATVSFIFAGQASSQLSSGGWVDPDSDSKRVEERIAAEFGGGNSSLVVLYRLPPGGDASDAQSQEQIASSLRPLRGDPRVAEIIGYAETRDARFLSEDGSATYALAQLDLTDDESVDQVDSLRALIQEPEGMTVQLTGYAPLTRDSTELSEQDLQRAELFSMPFAVLILVAVFASIVAAGMPLLVAGLAIPTTLAFIYFGGQTFELSIYTINVSTMLGLALAIDYSLFLVSRFREELARGREVSEAVQRSVATSGKAVAFSGLAVAIGLSGLLFFESSAIRSFGIGGAVVVGSSVFYALTFLPALLGMLGHRVNALSVANLVGGLRRLIGIRPSGMTEAPARPGWWERVAHGVMERPFLVLLPVLAFLLLAGSPFLRLEQGIADASVLPPGIESRDAIVAIREEFPAGSTPMTILADVQGEPTEPATIEALAGYAERLAAVEGIELVESFFVGLVDPATGAELTTGQVVQLFALPEAQRPPALQALLDRYVRGSTVRIDALSPTNPVSPEGTDLVAGVRAVDPGAGIAATVGGIAAQGRDFLDSQRNTIPFVVAWTLGATAVILFLLFGSIAISIKAVIMTLLSITASFGALVWIFQEGNLSNVLAFEPLGFTIAGNPIIMFSVLFGLSMDYEVLLLSRIQEAYRRTGDNTASVAEGLARTAGVITGAALIMVVVFGAFALAQDVTIKSIGVGMAIAVLLDATIIRVLLVPATMRLLGNWNWWAPGPLGRLADRLGFGHAEDDEAMAASGGAHSPSPART